MDIDGTSLVSGFNPLAAAPGETEAGMAQRWQRWFRGMNVYPQSIQLLAWAQQDGVEDIPGLRKWLKQAEHHEPPIISNGPALPHSATILTESHPQVATKLAERFLSNDALLSENLALLGRGAGIILIDDDTVFTTWNNPHSEQDSRAR